MNRAPRFLLCSLVTMAAACGNGDSSGTATAQPISLSELDGVLAAGPMRMEVKLVPGTLDAAELHAETGDDDEKIESAVTAIDAAAGTLTLDLGGVVVAYDSSTRFRTESDSDVARGSWESSVAAGSFLEIRRDLSATAQDPFDASFHAVDLRIAGETDEPSIEMMMDQDNLETTGPSTAVLRVLGLEIAISSSTQLYDDNGGSGSTGSSASQFEGTVASVDVAAGTLTLTNGTVVDASGVTLDAEGDLLSLPSVADAVAANAPVRGEGTGVANAEGVVVATSLKVEVDD